MVISSCKQVAVIEGLLQEIQMMNSNFSKKLLAVVLTTLFMVSMGASAAKCPKDKPIWNPVTSKCMKEVKK
jgi:hypothetical protein